MSQAVHILTNTIEEASGALGAGLFVGWDNAQAGEDDKVQGICPVDVVDGDPAPVVAIGSAIVKSGAAFANHAELCSDAAGKARAYDGATYTEVVARALQAATAADQDIEVLLLVK